MMTRLYNSSNCIISLIKECNILVLCRCFGRDTINPGSCAFPQTIKLCLRVIIIYLQRYYQINMLSLFGFIFKSSLGLFLVYSVHNGNISTMLKVIGIYWPWIAIYTIKHIHSAVFKYNMEITLLVLECLITKYYNINSCNICHLL